MGICHRNDKFKTTEKSLLTEISGQFPRLHFLLVAMDTLNNLNAPQQSILSSLLVMSHLRTVTDDNPRSPFVVECIPLQDTCVPCIAEECWSSS